MFGSGSAQEVWTNSNNGINFTLNENRTITNDWQSGGLRYPPGTTLGFAFILGADYYVLEQLYVGAEFGYGFTSNTRPDVVIEQISVDGLTTIKTIQLGDTSNGLGMYTMNSGMRIGIRF